MIKIIITLFMCIIVNLFASEKDIIIAYKDSLPNKNISKTIQQLLKIDPNYKKGLCYLFDKKCFKIGKVEAPNPDQEEDEEKAEKEGKPYHGKMIKALLPDYKNALKQFELSVDNYKNPVSAYEGLKLIYIQNPIKGPKKYELIKKLSTALYQYSNSCYGFLHYGKVQENGIATSPNKILALHVYSKGLNMCNQKTYYSLLFTSGILRIKKMIQSNAHE